jgi:DNA-binding transcriptional ArsR family regulator
MRKAQTATSRRDAARLPAVFGALGDAARFRIFRILLRQHGICVSEIAAELGVSVPAASHQLKLLEIHGLIRREKQGRKVCYAVRKDDPVVKKILRIL